jgi:pimeloyl-ACP methyl ester carboxylesterase
MASEMAPPIRHRTVLANGIRMHVVEQGSGPVVLLCHGFPESWYSYRHQLRALAAAGYHAVAPDMRGYGETERPEAVDQYTLLHLVGDMVGLLDALGEQTAVIVGHDWGAPVAWHCALLRPDRFRAVVGLSVPYRPPGQQRPTSTMPATEDALFYQLYFQPPGVAEADLERDPHQTLRRLLFAASGDAPQSSAARFEGMVSRREGLVQRLAEPSTLPEWLDAGDLATYVAEFARTGFSGGLNWYRNIDRNWELLAPFKGQTIDVPALYIAGDRDLVVRLPGVDRAIDSLSRHAPQLRQALLLRGCGHWTQQERPREVNAALIGFIRSL